MDRLLADDGCPWDREQTHESLRKYLIAFREKQGLNKTKMAERVAFSQDTDYRPNYTKMENGVIPITKHLVKRIAEVFGDPSLLYLYEKPQLVENLKYVLDPEEKATWISHRS